jgi:hypothetical protein
MYVCMYETKKKMEEGIGNHMGGREGMSYSQEGLEMVSYSIWWVDALAGPRPGGGRGRRTPSQATYRPFARICESASIATSFFSVDEYGKGIWWTSDPGIRTEGADKGSQSGTQLFAP